MKIRGITKADYDEISTVVDEWWAGPAGIQPQPFFFYELGHHALISEDDGAMAGFLLGFVTDSDPRVAYVHLVGIHPEYRRRGVGRGLYEEFMRHAKASGAATVKAITTVGNAGSVDFHRALGFEVTLDPDYAGPGRARQVFTRALDRSSVLGN